MKQNSNILVLNLTVQLRPVPQRAKYALNSLNSTLRNTELISVGATNDFTLFDKHRRECALLGSADAVLLNRIKVVDAKNDNTATPVRILCAVFTIESNHHRVRAVADTWARKCTAFLAFSDVEDDSIPAIHIPHEGAPRRKLNIATDMILTD